MGGCRIDECVVLVEAAALDFGALLELVEQLKILGEHHDLSLGDNNKVGE
jgi:hypothetical protein